MDNLVDYLLELTNYCIANDLNRNFDYKCYSSYNQLFDFMFKNLYNTQDIFNIINDAHDEEKLIEIFTCLKNSNEELICIKLNLIGHVNLIIFRRSKNILIFYEPNGMFPEMENTLHYIWGKICKTAKQIIPHIKIIFSEKLHNNRFGLQAITKGSKHGGLCLLWCNFMKHLSLKFPEIKTKHIIECLKNLTNPKLAIVSFYFKSMRYVNNLFKSKQIDFDLERYNIDFNYRQEISNKMI